MDNQIERYLFVFGFFYLTSSSYHSMKYGTLWTL